MNVGSNGVPGLSRLSKLALSLFVLCATPAAMGRGTDLAGDRQQRYIIEFQDPPLTLYARRQLQTGSALQSMQSNGPGKIHPGKLDMQAVVNRDYLELLASRQEEFRREAASLLGRSLAAVHRYRLASNGMAVDLTASEAAGLVHSPRVKSITPDVRYTLETYAGPPWIGSDQIWSGDSGFPQAQGEGIVVAVIDSGINWEHPSFADPSEDGYQYSNPYEEFLGLCADPEVECNNKLVGVYDFVEDDPGTEDVVEENTKGRDNHPIGHGSLVASIAVGNRLNRLLNGGADATLSGVAPRANLITYRACYVGEPEGPDTGGCSGSALLAAIDQAVADGVDVINYSIGSRTSSPPSPWADNVARAFLNARGAGVFIATSAGNWGPSPSTISAPANAPWLLAVGSATHNGLIGNHLQDLVGGDTAPPENIVGASLTNGTGRLKIVHARDYGFPLCGEGEPELEPDCDGNRGLSNPWAGQRPFNGEIVVCDRGIYGRVEKGKNVMQAGAGGYILANTEAFGETVVADEHCLPASHIGLEDGGRLRTWLQSGAGHGGSIGPLSVVEKDAIGDWIDDFSARGPGQPPIEDILKPNLIAPGSWILGASHEGQDFNGDSGTSFSSPHVAGAAALLKSVHVDWSPSQLASAIETTATPEFATVDGAPANPREGGAGRPQLGEAANAGLFLAVTEDEFFDANPTTGGSPRDLNLPSLVDSRCQQVCSFSRTVTDQMGGGNWTAEVVEFPPGVKVTLTPGSFALTNGGSQTLAVEIDLTDSGIVGEWVDGRIRLSAAGSPDQYLVVSVFAYGGELPGRWSISDDRDAGWLEFSLSGLAAMPDATFRSGGLQAAEQTVEVLVEDPTNSEPYDAGEGTFTKWHSLPEGALWLHAETLESTAVDLDLYVGRDDNGNGIPEFHEELCSSILEKDLERCDLYDLPAGDYWILVQNFTGTEPDGDEATLSSAAIVAGVGNLAASGPGIVDAGANFKLRLSWDNVGALPGEQWLGAVGIGTHREQPNNVGIIPLAFNRNGISEPETFALFQGVDHQLAVDAGATHDRLFIDVPPGAGSLSIRVESRDTEQNEELELELRRLDFEAALAQAPFAVAPDAAEVIDSVGGSAGAGPALTVSGSSLQAGRWYAVLTNGNADPVSLTVRAEVLFDETPLPIHRGLWSPSSRPGLSQGYDYNWGASERALIWYTYDEVGQPAWYIAGSPQAAGNIWVSDLYRVTNDGARQQLAVVGDVSVTTLAEEDALFTFNLFGQSGTDRMHPLSSLTCPATNGQAQSYTGTWYRGVAGLGGASVLVNDRTQAQIHYLFDDSGIPRWLFAQEPDPQQASPDAEVLPMLQFTGYCAVCSDTGVSYEPDVGLLTRQFSNESEGSWTLDYVLRPPLSGSVQRTEAIVKLTDTLDCR